MRSSCYGAQRRDQIPPGFHFARLRLAPGHQSPKRSFHRCNDEPAAPPSSRSATEPRASDVNAESWYASSRWWANYRRRWRESRQTQWTARSKPGWERSARLSISTEVPSMSATRRTSRSVRRIPGFERVSRPFPRHYDPEKAFPRSTELVMAGNTLTFARPSDIPPENKDARRFVERYGPKASAAIPMWAGGNVIGAATFGKFRSAREWSSDLLAQLSLAVRLFGSAIERKQSEMAIRAVRSELRVATRRNSDERAGCLAVARNQPAAWRNLEQPRRTRALAESRKSAARDGSGGGQQCD